MILASDLLQNYVRPVFVDDDEPLQIHICSGRHPVCILIPNLITLYACVIHEEYDRIYYACRMMLLEFDLIDLLLHSLYVFVGYLFGHLLSLNRFWRPFCKTILSQMTPTCMQTKSIVRLLLDPTWEERVATFAKLHLLP